MHGRLRSAWRAARNALGYGPASRLATVRSDDIFLVSYPRSGNTWLRFLVTNLIAPTFATDFVNIESRAPDIYLNSDRALLRLPKPRVLKSHEYFDPRYNRALYVVRDPRDVVSSYYRWHVRSGSIPVLYPGTRFLQRFLDGALDDPYGSWQTHVGSWLGARQQDPTFLLIRYEDMLSALNVLATRLCVFLELTRSDAEITSAVRCSARPRMQELEKTQKASSPLLRGKRTEIPFVGAANHEQPLDKSDEYLRSESARRLIESRFERTMSELGYL